MSAPLLSVSDLKVHFADPNGRAVRAVDGVSFDIASGETFGLVGESGCGKTTLARAVLGIVRPTEGEVRFRGSLIEQQARRFCRHIQMVFQDPSASLDPRMSAASIVAEPIHVLRLARGANVSARVEELLGMVGIHPRLGRRYPHEFSGGQRQRIAIARALAAEPDFIIADEPVSSLDVSIQAQILNLLEKLQSDLGLTYLFISHDLRAVRHISNRIAVMYLGKIVETASVSELYERPLMPYTRALIAAVPAFHSTKLSQRNPIVLDVNTPSPVNPPPGCCLHTRCTYALPECSRMTPVLREITELHHASCIRIGPGEPNIELADAKGIRTQQ